MILMNGSVRPANRAEGERFLRLCLNAAYAAFQHETGCEGLRITRPSLFAFFYGRDGFLPKNG